MIATRFRICLLFLLCGCPVASVAGQNITDTSEVAGVVERAAEKLLRARELHAVSVGVLSQGNVVTRHFGELTVGAGNPPDNGTVFEIASVTKTMVGFLAAAAVESGMLSVDADIRDHLPAPYPNLEYSGKPILIRHLLTHTSGLPGFLPLAWNGVFETFAADVPDRFRQLEAQYGKEAFWTDLATVSLPEAPGTTYAYSSAGTELLAYILEQVTGQPLAEQLATKLTGPNEMKHTRLGPPGENGAIRGYWMDNDEPSPHQLSPLWGGGVGITATVPDLLRYAALQMREDDPVVSRSHEVLFSDKKFRHIGFGWNVWYDKYGTSYNHHGGTSGVQNWLYIFPDHELAIVVMTNHSGPKTAGKLNQAVHRIVRQLVDTRK